MLFVIGILFKELHNEGLKNFVTIDQTKINSSHYILDDPQGDCQVLGITICSKKIN